MRKFFQKPLVHRTSAPEKLLVPLADALVPLFCLCKWALFFSETCIWFTIEYYANLCWFCWILLMCGFVVYQLWLFGKNIILPNIWIKNKYLNIQDYDPLSFLLSNLSGKFEFKSTWMYTIIPKILKTWLLHKGVYIQNYDK